MEKRRKRKWTRLIPDIHRKKTRRRKSHRICSRLKIGEYQELGFFLHIKLPPEDNRVGDDYPETPSDFFMEEFGDFLVDDMHLSYCMGGGLKNDEWELSATIVPYPAKKRRYSGTVTAVHVGKIIEWLKNKKIVLVIRCSPLEDVNYAPWFENVEYKLVFERATDGM